MADRHYVRCTVRGNALAESKEKKTPSVHIRLQAIPGANPIMEGYAEDRTLWADLWLTDAAIEASIETLEKTLGWSGNSFAELNEPVLEGIEVEAVCEWEQGQDGKWREKVLFLNAPGGGGVKKMEDAQVKTVVSKLDALLVRSRQNSGATTAKAPARTTPTRTTPTRQTTAAAPASSAGPTPDAPPPNHGRRGAEGRPDEDFFA